MARFNSLSIMIPPYHPCRMAAGKAVFQGLFMAIVDLAIGCLLFWAASRCSGIWYWVLEIPGWLFVGTIGLSLWHGMRKAKAFSFVGYWAMNLHEPPQVFELVTNGNWRKVTPHEYKLAARELERIGELELAKHARQLSEKVSSEYAEKI